MKWYYNYQEKVKTLVSHRILAINRAEKEKVINVNIEGDKDYYLQYITRGVTKNRETKSFTNIFKSSRSSIKILFPSIEREIRKELTEKADEQALKVFSVNLENLLLQAPLKNKMVLGVDPAYRTGCKLAVVDQTGKVLHIDKVLLLTKIIW